MSLMPFSFLLLFLEKNRLRSSRAWNKCILHPNRQDDRADRVRRKGSSCQLLVLMPLLSSTRRQDFWSLVFFSFSLPFFHPGCPGCRGRLLFLLLLLFVIVTINDKSIPGYINRHFRCASTIAGLVSIESPFLFGGGGDCPPTYRLLPPPLLTGISPLPMKTCCINMSDWELAR